MGAPTVDTDINFWPALIDMLTSVLMFFLLIYFVQHNLNPESLGAAIAEQKREQFSAAFEREFRNEIQSHEVSLASDVNILQITFGEQILFDVGHYDLQPRGGQILKRMARVVHSLNETSGSTSLYEQIQIEGHTDNRNMDHHGYPHDNWELSSARALEVLKFLTRRVIPSLDQKKMSANGYADTRPASVTDRDRNRRIEIRIYFSGKESSVLQRPPP
jgi:flagellar motor protein MotB